MTTDPSTEDSSPLEHSATGGGSTENDLRHAIADTVPSDVVELRPSLSIQIEGYDIVRQLSEGGQGVVYQAIQRSTKRKVAIKVLLAGVHASKSAKKRFEREIELVAQLKHPHIISVFHSGTTEEGHQYCVMDYVRGHSLHEYVRSNKLPLEETLRVFEKVCSAVQYAHQKGVIHRDLKPSNILVTADGDPKVLDFGLAKQLTAPIDTVVSITGQVVGTLPYMSPEQARGNPDEIDTRTDIYALGVILYELLTGHYPYPVVGNMAEVLKHIAETPPTPPSRQWQRDSGVPARAHRRLRHSDCPIDDDVQVMVLKALAKERDRRYQSAGEFQRDVEHYLSGEAIDAKRDSGWYLFRKLISRQRRRIISVCSVTVAIAGISALVWTLGVRKQQEAHDYVQVGVAHAQIQDWDDAIEAYKKALDIDPNTYRALANWAILNKDRYLAEVQGTAHDSPLTESVDLCDRALAINPRDLRLQNVKAVSLSLLGRLPEAEAACRATLAQNPKHYWSASVLAKVLAAQGRVDEALASAKRATRIATEGGKRHHPWSAGAWRTRGAIELYGAKPDAHDSLNSAVAAGRDDWRSYLIRARLWLHAGDHVDSVKAHQDAIFAHLATTDAPDGRVERVLALALLRKGNFEKAAYHARQAIAYGDVESFNHFILAIAEAKRGNVDGGTQAFDKGLASWPPELENKGTIANIDRGVLWFDTLTRLKQLRTEAEQAIASAASP